MLRNTINGVARPSFPTLASLQQRRAELLDLPPQPQAQPPEPDPDPPPWPGSEPQPSVAPPQLSANPVLGEAALYGPAGLAVRTIAPHTEAHPAAILFQLLAAFGNLVGRGPRCLWTWVQRNNCLPEGGNLSANDLSAVARELRRALN